VARRGQSSLDRLGQSRLIKWFGEKFVYPGRETGLFILWHRIRGQC
jgi:hypothetical protein